MKPKLIELAEILKQKPEIKERLERLEFGCLIGDKKRDCINDCDINTGIIVGYDILSNWKIFNLDNGFSVHEEDLSCCGKIIGREPQYSDVLEYLGEDYWINGSMICENHPGDADNLFLIVRLSPGPLAEQSDKTLDEIISLCKDNVPRN